MSTAKEPIETKRGTSTLVRPMFSPGLLLQDSDLNTAVDYGRTLTQLLFRNLFGCGVICGYGVAATVDNCNILQVTVGRGLALDCSGNPIELTAAQTLKVGGQCAPTLPCEIWVLIRARECNSAPREVSCTPEDGTTGTVCTRVCDGYEIRLVTELPECVCGCVKKTKQQVNDDCCAGTAAPGRTPEQAEALERIKRRLKPWDECDEEERKRRSQEMLEGAQRCDLDHRLGVCNCACCEWVLLSRLLCCEENDAKREYRADLTVRRFIRPALSYDYMAYEVKG
jgi:hypothetical protein